jgi:hypothetical protein
MRGTLSIMPSRAARPGILPSNSDAVNNTSADPRSARTFFILSAAALGMTALLALLPAAGHDQMWFLYAAQQVLRGTTLYGPHLLDSNPPLIVWMLLVPVGFANLLHLPLALVFKLFVAATELAVALACLHLLRRLQPRPTRTRLWALAFGFVCVFGAMPARDFGQRDHLLALLFLPYVLAAALDGRPPDARDQARLSLGARIAIGIVAGVAISLKPHHLIVPTAVEAALILKCRPALRRLFRPEALALLATCAVYLAAIRVFTPQYLTGALPILRDTYWAIGPLTLPQLIGQAIELHLLAAAAFVLSFITGWRKLPLLTILLLAAGTASTIAYDLQGTGWYYQQIPALSFFALALWLQLLDLAAERRFILPAWSSKAAAALSILAIALTAFFSGYTLRRPLSFPSGLSDIPDPSFFTGLPPNTPVAILTTVVDDSIPPIFTRHLTWAQRQNNLWTLPAILRNESPGPGDPRRRIPPIRLAQLDQLQHTWMVDDLAYWHPALILIQRCQDPAVHCQILEDRHDDLLAWFERDPRFRAIFSRYRYLRSSGEFDAYVLK